MKTYLRMLACLRPYPGTVALTWMFSIMIVGLQVVSVWVGANVVEKLLIHSDLPPALPPKAAFLTQALDRLVSAFLRQSSPYTSLLVAVGIVLGTQVLVAALRVAKLILFARVTQSVLADVRHRMFERLTECDLAFHKRYRHGEIASLFLMDVDQLRTGFVDTVDRLFQQPVRLAVGIVLMAMLSWPLTLCVVVVLMLAALFIHRTGKRLEDRFRAMSEKRAEVQGHLVEYLTTVVVARALGRERHEQNRFDEKCRDLKAASIQAATISALTPAVVSAIFYAAGAVILAWCGYHVLARRTMSSAVVIRMTFLLPFVTYPLEGLAWVSNSVRGSLASARRIFAFLDRPAPWRELPGAVDPPPFRSEIALQDVMYESEGRCILDGISLTIPRGSLVVLFGPSGAGKSTLLSLLAAFVRATGGSIRIDGADIGKFRAGGWRRQLGIVPQDCVLLNATVRENLLCAREDASDADLFRVLEQAGVTADASLLRDGLDTVVGNRGEMLSGGERQRLTIARALLNDPAILLLDEPTSMLDQEHKLAIGQVIRTLASSRTVVVATHDLYLRGMADIAVELNEGKVAAPAEAVEKP